MSESHRSEDTPADLPVDGTPADTGRSRWRLWGPVLAVVAVVAVAAGTILAVRGGGGGAGSGEPPVIALADGATAAIAPEAPGLGTTGPVTIEGTLPTSPTSAAARTLPGGQAPQDTVAALARALGLSGTPKHTNQGWRVVDGARTLQVSDTPGMPWGLIPAQGYEICVGRVGGPEGSPPCPVYRLPGGPPVVVAPPSAGSGHKNPGGNTGGPVSGTGGGSSGSSGSAGSGVVTDPATSGAGRTEPGSLPKPGRPADDGAVSTEPSPASTDGPAGNPGGTATGAPNSPPTGGPAGDPNGATGTTASPGAPARTVPAPTLPTDADALATAKPVLTALGIADARTRVDRTGPLTAVVADPVVDGLVTDGYHAVLLLAADGTVKGAGGWLAHPATGASYPLVSASDAIKTVVVPAIARLCGTKACPQQPMVVTGAELGLTLRYQSTATTPILVPAWRYTVRDRPTAFVLVAVQPKYLGDRTGRPNVPGGAPPVTADPGGKINNGGPGVGSGGPGAVGGQPGNPNVNPNPGTSAPASPPH